MEEKVDFGYSLFEQTVSVDSVFQPNEMLDTIAITKGKGTEGVVTRWGVTRLPRKTHRGLRKVTIALSICLQSVVLHCFCFCCISCEGVCTVRHQCSTHGSADWLSPALSLCLHQFNSCNCAHFAVSACCGSNRAMVYAMHSYQTQMFLS
jgi:hypothetical protein